MTGPESRPRLAITAGEPAGIGPDLCIQLAQDSHDAGILVYADPEILQQRAKQLGLPLKIIETDEIREHHKAGTLRVFPIQAASPCTPGQLDSSNSASVLDCIREATLACQTGQVDALVTAPVHKGIINEAGIAFSGHTEYLAELTHATPVMMLGCSGLKVALVTTHLPLSEVSPAITSERLTTVIRILHHDLQQKFALDSPRIHVCGLNPHAGEGGHLGKEEIEIISPVLDTLRQQGMKLFGPLSADTLFTPKYLEHTDAILAMYHDQGLPVLKHMGFGEAVNITLGLPIIRTSVDHGTALELAGTGQANFGSMAMALETAVEMIHNQ